LGRRPELESDEFSVTTPLDVDRVSRYHYVVMLVVTPCFADHKLTRVCSCTDDITRARQTVLLASSPGP